MVAVEQPSAAPGLSRSWAAAPRSGPATPSAPQRVGVWAWARGLWSLRALEPCLSPRGSAVHQVERLQHLLAVPAAEDQDDELFHDAVLVARQIGLATAGPSNGVEFG